MEPLDLRPSEQSMLPQQPPLKRKRLFSRGALIIDQAIAISNDDYKVQLSNADHLLRHRQFLPKTREEEQQLLKEKTTFQMDPNVSILPQEFVDGMYKKKEVVSGAEIEIAREESLLNGPTVYPQEVPEIGGFEMPELPLRVSEVPSVEHGMPVTPLQQISGVEEESNLGEVSGKLGSRGTSTIGDKRGRKRGLEEFTPSSEQQTGASTEVLLTLTKQYKPLGIVAERTLRTIGQLKTAFNTRKQLSSFGLLGPSPSKQVAARFFLELLILKTKDVVDIQQKEPFGDLIITRSKAFVY